MALPKWTDERTQSLVDFVGSESPISQDTVANAADELETSVRSVSSKLRKMGYDVELASASASKSLINVSSFKELCFFLEAICKAHIAKASCLSLTE